MYQVFETRSPNISELELVRELRHAVLDPERVKPFELELTKKDFDENSVHMAVFVGNSAVVSTVRLDRIDDKTYEVRKMATHPDFQKKGLGSKVLLAAEKEAILRGAKIFMLDSRETAKAFYASLDYSPNGQEITHDDGIPNFRMIKKVENG